VHPNEEVSVYSGAPSRRPSYLLGKAEPSNWVNSRFVNWFVIFDETKLRPFLIRNYSLSRITAQDKFEDAISRQQLIAKDGDVQALENSIFEMNDDSMVFMRNPGASPPQQRSATTTSYEQFKGANKDRLASLVSPSDPKRKHNQLSVSGVGLPNKRGESLVG